MIHDIMFQPKHDHIAKLFIPELLEDYDNILKVNQYSHRSDKEKPKKCVIYSAKSNQEETKTSPKLDEKLTKKTKIPLKSIPIRTIESSLTQKKLKSTKIELKNSMAGTSVSTKGKSTPSTNPKDSKGRIIKPKKNLKSASKVSVSTSKEGNGKSIIPKLRLNQSKDLGENSSKDNMPATGKLSKALENYEQIKFSLDKKNGSAPTIMKRHSSYSKLSCSESKGSGDMEEMAKLKESKMNIGNSCNEKDDFSNYQLQRKSQDSYTIEESLNLLKLKIEKKLVSYSKSTNALLKMSQVLKKKLEH